MKDTSLSVAQEIARELTKSKTDVNELAKAFTHLRTHKNGREFFKLLDTMVTDGGYLVRSGRTLDYYREIYRVCDKYLRDYRDKPDEMAEILGWAIRLMRYYAAEPGLTPPQPPEPSLRPEKRPAATPPTERPRHIRDLREGMVLTGTVRRIMPYGAFVDIGVGRDGLVHISELAEGFVHSVEDVVSVGQEVTVRVKEIDLRRDRIGLSLKGIEQ